MGRVRRLCEICDQLARLLQGTAECREDVCTVTVDRTNLIATILGRTVRSEEILGIHVVFESPDEEGRTLDTVEATLLEEEVNRFIRVFEQSGIKVTAIHNHWLFEDPRLMYVHAEAVKNPVRFAKVVAEAIRTLTVPPKPRPETTTG